MRKNIYLTFTPYHIFLAAMIALRRPDEEHVLISVADFAADEMLRALQNSTVFTACRQLKGLFKQKSGRNTLRRNNARTVSRALQEYGRIDALFLGTDTRIEAQAAAGQAKAMRPAATVAVLEDGGDFYNSSQRGVKTKGFWRTLHSKLIFGKWYEDVEIAGLYTATEELHVVFPALTREELRCKKQLPISCEPCFGEAFREFTEEYWRCFTADKEKIMQSDGIVMIAHSGFSAQTPQYAALMRRICERAAERGLRLAVKYHPREEEDDYCRLSSLPNITLIAGRIPAELIYVSAAARLQVVVGDISSALMTAKWILRDAVRVYSVAPALQIEDRRLLRVFQQIGVRLVGRLAELRF